MVLATLPGEEHGICLQMAAIGVVAQGGRVRILGTSTPIEQIVRAAEETQARGVAVSVSLANGGVATDRELGRLRKALPADVRLAAGGEGMRGARRGSPGVTRLSALDDLNAWIRSLDDVRRQRSDRVRGGCPDRGAREGWADRPVGPTARAPPAHEL